MNNPFQDIIDQYTPEIIEAISNARPWLGMRLYRNEEHKAIADNWIQNQPKQLADHNEWLFRAAMQGLYPDKTYIESLFYYTVYIDDKDVKLIAYNEAGIGKVILKVPSIFEVV